MFIKGQLLVLPVSLALLAAGDQPWKDKQINEWTEDDAKLVLTDSPWAKSVTPTVGRSQQQSGRRGGGGMGRGGGIGIGGIGLGIPGLGGMGRRGGMGGPGTGGGYPGGGYPSGGQTGGTGNGGAGSNTEPPLLKLRWESALPVRSAELKVRETAAPTVDDSHYAIAVYGVPRRAASGDSKTLQGDLKKEAALKRDGKKDLKPSSVEVLQREDGPVIVYLFPRTKEITRQDKVLHFDARIGRFQFTQSFYVDDMTYGGKLEL
jgi:hypothetical protein